ncbi:hypothetical protein ACFLUC_03695, partial [Chloroflexota bacterium]
IEQLEPYLFSKEIYWSLGVRASRDETPYPQLTLGGMLLSRYRLSATAITEVEKQEFTRIGEQMDSIRIRWRQTWSNKAQTEFQARLKLWQTFIEEYLEKPTSNFDRYKFEVGRRVLLDLLKIECLKMPNAKVELLGMLDIRLRNIIIISDFIWENNLEPIFPPSQYWYLYGYLPKN